MNTFHRWWSNFTDLFTTDADPEEIIEQEIFALEKQLVSLKQSSAQAISSLRKNEKLAADYRSVSTHWYRQAKVNLYCQKTALARESLENCQELNQLRQEICRQIAHQQQIIRAIKKDIEKLDTKIAQIKSYRTSFNTRSRNAETNQYFYEQGQTSSVQEVINRWEEQVRDTEIAEGWEESLNTYLEEEFEAIEKPMLNNIQQWLEAEPSEIKDVNIDQELANLQKDLDKIS